MKIEPITSEQIDDVLRNTGAYSLENFARNIAAFRDEQWRADREKRAQVAQPVVAQVVSDPDGSNKRVIFNSYQALYDTPLWTKLYAAPTEACKPVQAEAPTLEESCESLYEAGHEFFKARRRDGLQGSVCWVEYDDGTMVIFTRGEYKGTLIKNIDEISEPKSHVFTDPGAPDADKARALTFATKQAEAPTASNAGERDSWRGGSNYEASMLRNLLARIHGDGGHYLEQHGLEKAVEDADQLVSTWRAQVPEQVAQDSGEPPLLGRWHHGEGHLVSGSIRIARWDCDTNPPDEFRDEVLEWVCNTLNAGLRAARTSGEAAK